jgi:hypothetical protein
VFVGALAHTALNNASLLKSRRWQDGTLNGKGAAMRKRLT